MFGGQERVKAIFQQAVERARIRKRKLIPLFKVFMPDSVKEPLLQTLLSGYIGQGAKVEELEERLGKWIGNKNVLTVNTGTSALHLAYHLCLQQPGDEIITTPMTCVATNTPIVNTKQGKIVWADVDPLTGLIDPVDIEGKITGRTRAIVMVNWGGNPCDIDRINQVAHRYNIKTIEDSAHSLGTIYNGRRLGKNTSDFVIYSFQAIKQITTVDGGALICRANKDYQRAKLLRWYGIDREIVEGDFRCEIDIKEAGYKFHMNDVTATIGIEMLKYIGLIVAKHRENANYYNANLKVEFVKENPAGKSAYQLYVILLPKGKRDAFITYMLKNSVQVSKVHVRNDTHTAFKQFQTTLPGVDEFNARHCCIPVGWWVTEQEREKIVKLVNKFL